MPAVLRSAREAFSSSRELELLDDLVDADMLIQPFRFSCSINSAAGPCVLIAFFFFPSGSQARNNAPTAVSTVNGPESVLLQAAGGRLSSEW